MHATPPCPDPPEPCSLASLVTLAAGLAQPRSRPESARHIAEFLRRIPPSDRPLATRLLVGRPFPEADPRALDVNAAALWRVASRLSGSPEPGPPARAEVAGVGQAVERGLAGVGWTPDPPPLTLREVAHAFEVLAAQ